jgi:hypothetical protein
MSTRGYRPDARLNEWFGGSVDRNLKGNVRGCETFDALQTREWRSALAQQLHFEMFERVHVMPQNNSARLTGCSQA